MKKHLIYWLVLTLSFLLSCNDAVNFSTLNNEQKFQASLDQQNRIQTTIAVGYTTAFEYGTIIIEEGVVDSFESIFQLVNPSNVPEQITIGEVTGVIIVVPGLGAGEYSFQVKVSGTGEYAGRSDTVDLKLFITREITESDFSVEVNITNKTGGFVTYKRIILNEGVTADFNIVGLNPQTDSLAISEDGDMIVSPTITNGTYTVQVEITGTRSYTGTIISNLTLAITDNESPIKIAIAADDFTAPTTPVTKIFDYTDPTYGTITANEGQTANFEIVRSDAPNNEITINENGVITVVTGLVANTYTFDVKVTGIGNYEGSFNLNNFTLIIDRRTIVDSDFTISKRDVSKPAGYTDNTYGKIAFDPNITVDFANDFPVSEGIIIDARGNITISPYPVIIGGDYAFKIRITGIGNYTGLVFIENLKLSVEITQPSITSLHNYDNSTFSGLNGAEGVATTLINNVNYVFITGFNNSILNVFTIDNNTKELTLLDAFPNSGSVELREPRGVTTGEVSGNTYIFVAGFRDNGVSVFIVGANGKLAVVDNQQDNNNILELNGPYDIHTEEIGDSTFLFVSGTRDRGISVFEVLSDGKLYNSDNVTDNGPRGANQLNFVRGLTTAKLSGETYLLAAGFADDGISVFKVDNSGKLTTTYNLDDANTPATLDGITDITTAVIGGKTYVFTANRFSSSVSIFELQFDGTLSYVDNVLDDENLQIRGASSVVVEFVNSDKYLFVGGYDDGGVSMFSINDATGQLTNVANVSDGDNPAYEMQGTENIAVGQIMSGAVLLFVTGKTDNGISIFEVRGQQ